jgi:tRNA A-37 threonylcarbamoyl transferase component Bud32
MHILAAAFLLPIIGEPFTHATDVTDIHGPRILETLNDLHWNGVVHNDAKFTNVVRVRTPTGTTYRWIDLRAPSGDSKDYAADVETFLHSVGRAPQAELLKNYSTGMTERWRWGVQKDRYAAMRALWATAVAWREPADSI